MKSRERNIAREVKNLRVWAYMHAGKKNIDLIFQKNVDAD